MAPLETYVAGDVWVSNITFEKPDGTLVDPTTVKFAYSVAGGTPVRFTYGVGGTPSIINLGLGNYQISIDTSTFATASTGTVQVSYLWQSNGTVGQGVEQGVIQVQPPIIPLG